MTKSEMDAFEIRRSRIAFEMMMDFIFDEQKAKAEIEKYVKPKMEGQ